jgi:FtsP/CotA-like multicopper oxidase with cupredoxin domain
MRHLTQRRDFLKIAGAAAASGALLGQQMQMPQSFLTPAATLDVAKTEFKLEIAPITVELAPNRVISTVGYNGKSPGPLLRMKEGVPVTVNVVNNTDVPEYVHFHGLLIPSDVDGAEEEGTPAVPPHGTRSYRFTPTPAGTRWYHTHTMSMDLLHQPGDGYRRPGPGAGPARKARGAGYASRRVGSGRRFLFHQR